MPAETALRSDASLLYNTWACELGISIAWERLSDREQRAWFKVVDLAADDLDSREPDTECLCGREMACTVCDDWQECSGCETFGTLRCEACWFAQFVWEYSDALSLNVGESR